MSKKTLILITFVLLSAGLAIAGDLPDDPMWFYGPVTIGGSAAPAGSTVTATISGRSYPITTTVAGQYGSATGDKLAVTHYSTDTSTSISFSITASGCSVTGTITDSFEEGKIENKTLAFGGSCGVTGGGGEGAGGGGGGGAGAGGGGAAAPKVTETLVTDSSVISSVQQSLPADWSNVVVYSSGSATSKPMETNSETINNALTYATEQKAISALQTLKTGLESGDKVQAPTTTTLQVYHVENKDTGDWTYTTGVTITVTSPENLQNVEVIETIPSSVASSEEIVFIGKQPEILQSKDGIIAKWTIDSLDSGESAELKYFIKKRVTSVKTTTLAGGEKAVAPPTPPPPTPPEAPPVKPIPWVGIVIIAAIVVIGLVAYFAVTKKKK